MQADFLKQKMDQTKDMVLNRILLVLFFFMAVGLTISLLRVPETGFKIIYGVQMALALVMVILYLFRNKMRTEIRGGIFLMVIYAMAISSILTFGSYGFGWAYFIPASAISFLYFSKRTGWILSVSNFVILGITAYLFMSGVLSFHTDNPNYMISLPNWLNLTITTLLITIVIVLFWNNLYNLVSNTFVHIYNQQEDMKRMNEELILARDKALESDKLKSSFLQNISHEIRTPLNIIIGFSDMVAQTEDPEEQKEFNKVIRDNSNNMLKIVNDIVDFSKIETNTLNLQHSKFNIKEVLDTIEKCYSGKGEVASIKFEMEEIDANVELDKERFTQILQNILDNAFKFTNAGSIQLKCKKNENFIHFNVIDTGIGISGEDQQKIFERFFRVDPFSGGAGLGLSLSKSFAVQMGGDIKVTSEPGNGSNFEIIIPYLN